MQEILIVQPAFLGDLILCTAIIEKISAYYPDAKIDVLLRKGYERILSSHPKIRRLLVFDRKNKRKSLNSLVKELRANPYDLLINLHRHFSAGYLSAFSKANVRVGFRENPWSWTFSKSIKHQWNLHEIERNQLLIAEWTDEKAALPKLYPQEIDEAVLKTFSKPYITISPASIWPTKQLPLIYWAHFINQLPDSLDVLIMGGPADSVLCSSLEALLIHPGVRQIAGNYTFMEDLVIMKHASMNYVLDSAPLHMCSAINAPTAAVFCSTSPKFGFGPLADRSFVIEVNKALKCRPCGAHGKKKCPKRHFHCSMIQPNQLFQPLELCKLL